MIMILETPPLNTVQDLGRPGYRNLGVGSSGVMDPLALEVGNILLGNARGDACIELQTYPFSIRFDATTSFAITGIDAEITLDGMKILPWSVETAGAGQVLRVGPPTWGARGYVCVAGGIDVPGVLGSRSTQLRGAFGGLDGRPLEAGDTLATGASTRHLSGYGALPPTVAVGDEYDEGEPRTVNLRAIPATDYALFTPDSQQRFWHTPWRITPQSNRVGYRLAGESLRLHHAVELRSYGIVPGIVQVPPAGEPIVQLADANTAGGYPRIATVIEADLWRLAQARIGTRIRFHECTHQQGVAAMQPVAAYLDDLRMMVAHYQKSARCRSGAKAGEKA
ncbi:allophanate hydrolase [Komagataeibacter rhaeticus]|uniref:5-oxoprolinase subunit C family protein n=1 Tax=Komagataeibacter rhaeticus TaxID=215221 RepID=UPI000D81A01B|nr:biotin-dependent carboxyltransferase family protein [Komagataeibacter rhaeticus]PYD54410.1 allophanate hydrolase [Komagataeibacter rhaeticus]GBQ12886.1 allophanate hydrolase subunit 2 [Komagataeibacter rhaeticus DSM 16663]